MSELLTYALYALCCYIWTWIIRDALCSLRVIPQSWCPTCRHNCAHFWRWR